MNEITTEALLWMAQDMGLDHVIESEDGNVRYGRLNKIIDLSGDTPESKALLFDVEGWLNDKGIYIKPCSSVVSDTGMGWQSEITNWKGETTYFHSRILPRPEAIQAAVMYLYERRK